MRRKDRELSREEAERFLRENQYGVLSTVCADGRPYGLPLSYAYAEGKLFFHHTAAESLLSGSIGEGAEACFTVVGRTRLLPEKFSTDYESAIAFGTVRPCRDKVGGLMRLVEALSPEHKEAGLRYAQSAQDQVNVYELEIRQLTGKARRSAVPGEKSGEEETVRRSQT